MIVTAPEPSSKIFSAAGAFKCELLWFPHPPFRVRYATAHSRPWISADDI